MLNYQGVQWMWILFVMFIKHRPRRGILEKKTLRRKAFSGEQSASCHENDETSARLSRWTRQLRTGDLFSQDVEFHWLILQNITDISWDLAVDLGFSGFSLLDEVYQPNRFMPILSASMPLTTTWEPPRLSSSVPTNLWVDVSKVGVTLKWIQWKSYALPRLMNRHPMTSFRRCCIGLWSLADSDKCLRIYSSINRWYRSYFKKWKGAPSNLLRCH